MNEIARAIAEGFKFMGEVYKKSYSRRIRRALEAAEDYIFVNERDGEFKDITDKKRTALLNKYRKRFFGNN